MLTTILVDQIEFYNELYSYMNQSTKEALAKTIFTKFPSDSFINQLVPILISLSQLPTLCIGYGILPLFLCCNNQFWTLQNYLFTSVCLKEEYREPTFTQIPFIVEEVVRELGGAFVESRDQRKEFAIVDRNMVSCSNDVGALVGVKSLLEIAKKAKTR